MGALYVAGKTATALSTTADHLTLTAPATRALKIKEIRFTGAAAASAYNEIGVYRSTGGATPVAATITPVSSGSPAAASTVAASWTTQPTLGALIRRIGLNANGAINPLLAMPNQEIEVPPSGQISIRSISGTSLALIEIVWEEVGG